MAIIGTLMLEVLNRYSDVSSVEYKLTSIFPFSFFFGERGCSSPLAMPLVGENLGFG